LPTATQIVQETLELAPAPIDYEPVFQEAVCPFELPPGQVEGQTVECGYLEVPENRADPNSRQIRLAAAIFRHPDGVAQSDPIIFLSGGPGGSSLELLNLVFDQVFSPYFAAGRDLIFFDQRGIIDLLDNQVGGRHLSDEEAYDLVLKSFLSCGDDLEEVADLTAYNTLANAADVNDLRIALGYDQVNLWGVSYGTRLALEVLRDFPEGLRSVILDSAYPPDVDLNLDAPANADRAFNVLFNACEQDSVCNQNYPDLREVFFNTVDLLEARPYDTVIVNPLTGESFDAVIDGDTLMGLIFQFLYETELLPNLPMLIYQANQGDFEMLSRIFGLLQVEIPLISRGMSLSVQCNEEVAFSSLEEFRSVLADYPKLAPLFSQSTLGEMGFQICQEWNSGEANPIENEPVTSQVPALILAGEFDPITPPAWGHRVTETLENSYYYEYPGVGHGASTVEGCPRQMTLAFIESPTQAPENICIEEMAFEFVTPIDLDKLSFAPVEVPEIGIQASIPEGWTQVQPDYYISPDQSIEIVFIQNQDPSPESFLQRVGASDPIEQIQANDLTWTLYSVSIQDLGAAGYVGVSPGQEGFYILLVLTMPEKQNELYETLFLPTVKSIRIATQ
jgi:pimeloyl-ACP methyl ester carboxylesterase